MVKRFSVTISDYIYEIYLGTFFGNRSNLIETMLIKGFEADLAEVDSMKKRILEMTRKIVEQEEEIRKLKESLRKFESKKKNKGLDDELRQSVLVTKGMLASGFNEWVGSE